jgi:Meiotically Up-regulated Gene 113 (MUG113) protein
MSNRKRRQAVYIISTDRGVVKVGISDDPVLRLAQLQTGAPYPLRLAYAFVHSDASRIEAMVHRDLRAKRCYGEWFSVTEAVARDAVYRAAAQIGKPIDGSGMVTPRMRRTFWFMIGLSIVVLWMVFSFIFSLAQH